MEKWKEEICALGIFGVALLFVVILALQSRKENRRRYDLAKIYIEQEHYIDAIEELETIRDFRDVNSLIEEYEGIAEQEYTYSNTMKLCEDKKYEEAVEKLKTITGYKDSEEKLKECAYKVGLKEFNKDNYEDAREYFMLASNYKDSELYLAITQIKIANKYKKTVYEKAKELYPKDKEKSLELFNLIKEYKDSDEYIDQIEILLTFRR